MQFTIPARAALLGALVLSSGVLAQSGSEPPQSPSFEPAARELWVRGSERFQRQWLVAGPIDAAAARGLDPASFQPAPGQPVDAHSQEVRWSPQTSWGDVIDLDPLSKRRSISIGAPTDRFIFAAATLSRKEGAPVDLAIGSERPYSVWVNGRLVHTRETAETFVPDADRVHVELQQGDNAVVLRFHELNEASSQFTLRAVPVGAALTRMNEITPALADSTDGLAVRTHVANEDGPAVELDVIAAGGEVIAHKSAARGEVVKFDSSGWRDGAYEIRASTKDAWGKSSVRYLPWYKGDARVESRRLIAAAEHAQSGVEGDTLRMLAAMVKDRVGGSIDRASTKDWPKIHSPLMEFEELQAGNVRAGGFVRLAYTDEVDGSTQYCRAYLPQHYAKDKAFPLIVFLHGFNPPNPEYINWWTVDERHNAIADSRDVIMVEPHGRGNAQYLGIGDRDVLKCIDAAKRRFSVDADRVYLTGESMGGHGTWAIATRHPDIFAAAAPVYGGWDFRVTDVSGPPIAPAPRTALEAFAFERSSSFADAENLLHVPMLITHGDADPNVSVENSRHAVRMLQRWGYDVQYHEMPGWAHEDLGERDAIADWLLAHTRVKAPKTVRLRSTDLAAASAYWIKVRAFNHAAEVIRVDAAVLQPGVIRIDSTNVAALTLNLPDALRGTNEALQVIWNGKSQQVAMNGSIADLGTIQDAHGLHKRAGLEGSLPAVIATPFAIVVGTTSNDPRMREFIQARADFFVHQWRSWQHQAPRVLKDTKVTARDEKTYSLILLGGADANAVTRRFKNKLPFSASSKGIVVDGREWHVFDAVLQAIYPSPIAADRYVYVVAATSAEGMYFWKPQLVHFVQGYPLTMFDWVIQDGRRAPVGRIDPANAFVAAGVFDASWRRADQLIQQRDASASHWTLRHAPPKDFEPSTEALKKIAGSYEVFPGFAITVRTEGTQVFVDVPGEPSLAIPAESDWIYLNPVTGDSAEFVRDEQGNITGMAVEDTASVRFFKKL
jgi:poly(3-hydroxybutyrate) depolymerase